MLEPGEVGGGVKRMNPNALRCLPGQFGERLQRAVLGILEPLLTGLSWLGVCANGTLGNSGFCS